MSYAWDELARDLYYHNVPGELVEELAAELYRKGWRKNVISPPIIHNARIQSMNIMPAADPQRGIYPIKMRN